MNEHFSGNLGGLYDVRGEFRDANAANQTDEEIANGGRLIDPTTVKLKRRTPGNVITELTYNPGAITRESTGKFRYQQSLDEVGIYVFKWMSTGTGQAATPDFKLEVGQTVFD